jgi:hypothetical protein
MKAPNRKPAKLRFFLLAIILLLLTPMPAAAFWLLGFSTADTLPQGGLSAIAGTGGQITTVGRPPDTSFTPFLAHAGIRLGLADGWDVGYRLVQVSAPFASVGPTLGGEVDLKYRLTPSNSDWQVALVGGFAVGFLDLSGSSNIAWSPGVDLIFSHEFMPGYKGFFELREVYTAIPTAPGGQSANYVNAAGIGFGMSIALTDAISVVPEIGVYDAVGRLSNRSANGTIIQYGAVLNFRF